MIAIGETDTDNEKTKERKKKKGQKNGGTAHKSKMETQKGGVGGVRSHRDNVNRTGLPVGRTQKVMHAFFFFLFFRT